MFHLLGVATGGRPVAAAGCGRQGRARAALGGVERWGAVLAGGHGHAGILLGPLVERHLLLLLEQERAGGAHHHLAIAAEAVAIDRRVGDHDLLIGIGHGSFVVEVARGRILIDAVDMVVDLPVGRENAAVADGRHRQRLDLLPLAVGRRHKDARRVELVATQLRHQAAAGPLPEPPANEFLERRPRGAVGHGQRGVAMLCRVDVGVEQLGLGLGDPLPQGVDVGGLRFVERLLPTRELLEEHLVARHRRLPGILAGKIAAVPLGPDRVEVADQASGADRVDGVVIQDAVMSLVAGGQEFARLAGDAAHLLALPHAVPHELLGEHMLAGPQRLDRGHRVELQRQRDDHGLHIGIGEQFLVGLIHLDLLAGRVFAVPAILGQESGPGLGGTGARGVAVEGTKAVVGADVGDGHDVDVVGIDRPNQHAPLVAGAEHAHAERVAHALAVAEIERPQARPGCHAGGHAGQEVSAGDPHGLGEVFLADLLLLLARVHRVTSGWMVCVRGCRRGACHRSSGPAGTRIAATAGGSSRGRSSRRWAGRPSPGGRPSQPTADK